MAANLRPDQMEGMRMFDDTIRLLGQLIGFPSVSSASNMGLIDWAADYLSEHGAQIEITRDATGSKGNLFATFGRLKGRMTAYSPSPTEAAEWAKLFADTRAKLRGAVFNAAVFDEAVKNAQ